MGFHSDWAKDDDGDWIIGYYGTIMPCADDNVYSHYTVAYPKKRRAAQIYLYGAMKESSQKTYAIIMVLFCVTFLISGFAFLRGKGGREVKKVLLCWSPSAAEKVRFCAVLRDWRR